jgi:hypothetical protein
LIQRAFDPKAGGLAELTHLMRRLEEHLETPRAEWPSSLLRRFATTLMECEACRRADAAYEEKWLNLMGYFMRPGYGFALVDWRIGECGSASPRSCSRKNVRPPYLWWIFCGAGGRRLTRPNSKPCAILHGRMASRGVGKSAKAKG